MKILITGINGFIGRHLAKELIKRGHEVVGLGRSDKCKVKKITLYYSGSILSKQLVTRAMKGTKTVVHLAALTSHKEIIDKKFDTVETNFLGTKNVLGSFLQSKHAKKFIYSSSGKVYGRIMHLPITEEHPPNPINILGKSKLITERLIDFYNDNQKEFIIFRIFNVYGPLQRKNFLIPTILTQLKHGTKLVLGDVEAKRDYVHIDDLVRAFILAIEGNESLGVSIYNICTNRGTSAKEIGRIISKIKGRDIAVISNPALVRHDEMKDEYGSYEKAQKNLGWKPQLSIEEGLQKMIKQ